MESLFWLGALIVFGVAEAVTVGLTSVWFALGALGALTVAALGGGLWLQITVFIALSALSMILLRPLAKKYLTPGYRPTNADRVIGAIGIVTEEINNLKAAGLVSVFGQIWTARSEQDIVIPPGVKVKILRIEGVKIFVEMA